MYATSELSSAALPGGPKAHKSFRADIEGLRAISILAVVLYHADVPGFAGGFVGVDVFFVISGFLISGLLLDELRATGRIDLLNFWSRRARRLLPNATLVLLTTLVAGMVCLPGHNRTILASEVAAASMYFANYLFASRAVDYFHFHDALSPVLHFWSLSIEEQFYIAWPLALIAIGARAKWQQLLIPILAVLAALSFYMCVTQVIENQPLAFFHTETRVWQLAVGAIVAEITRNPGRLSFLARLSPTSGLIGMAMIVVSVFCLNDQMTYPGFRALLPTAGAALVLARIAPQTRVSLLDQILGHKSLQWVGQRSYSWYLWHWPVIIFAPAILPSSGTFAPFTIFASLAIAAVAYAKVEDPIRRRRIMPGSAKTILTKAAGVVMLTFAASSTYAMMPNFRGTATTEQLELLKAAPKDVGRNYVEKCHADFGVTTAGECIYGAISAKRSIVLFGDSHAAQWFAPIEKAALAENWKLKSWTKSACPAVDVTVWYPPKKAPYTACDEWRRDAMRRLTGPDKPDVVLLGSSWNYSGWMQDRASGSVLYNSEAHEQWQNGLTKIVSRLITAGVKVVILRDTPQAYRNFADCVANGGTTCDRPRHKAVPSLAPERVAENYPGVQIFDATDQICSVDTCPVFQNGVLVYRDYNHIGSTFALSFSGAFQKLLAQLRD